MAKQITFYSAILMLWVALGFLGKSAQAQCTGEVLNISASTPSQTGTTGYWTAPSGGPYKVRISAKGAAGGNGVGTNNDGAGAPGAIMEGDFIVAAGQVIDAIAGAKGFSGQNWGSGGGGGGSGVMITPGIPVIIAGGGAGNGFYGSLGGSILMGNGAGGSGNKSGGGGGFLSPGGAGFTNGIGDAPQGGGAGFNAIGGLGRFANSFFGGNGGGGFGAGGGGNVTSISGGGGGGYSGGASGGVPIPNAYSTPEGGYSINTGTNQNNTPGTNNGGGQVIIECLGAAIISATFTPTQPVCANPTQGSLSIDLTGDLNGNTSGVEYAIVSGNSFSGTPTFADITADPFDITSGFGTTGDPDGEIYTVRIRLKYNPTLFIDNTYTLTQPICPNSCPAVVLFANAPTHSTSGTTANWTVPAGGPYKVTITAKGAVGGNKTGAPSNVGGKGASMSGDFIVSSGQTLQAIAGAPGQSIGNDGGGGGGSGVQFQSSGTLLVLAGGGGGAGYTSLGGNGNPGVTTNSGTNGGTAGSGGGGGGGFVGNGQTSSNTFSGGGGGGGFNGTGGYGTDNVGFGGGGFGAGGGGGHVCNFGCVSFAAGNFSGGGGGGYTGGYGGGGWNGGGGGGSYNIGANQLNTAGDNNAGGQIIISCQGTATLSATVIPTKPVCANPTQGSLSIDLTGDLNSNTSGVEYAIVSGNSFTGTPTFADITADPFSITSGFGTVADLDGETYTIRVRLKYNPTLFIDNTYALTQPTCPNDCPAVVLFANAPTPSQTGTTGSWTVPAGGPYKLKITAKGAQGGNSPGASGGTGAIMIGDFFVSQGQVLEASAGAKGTSQSSGVGGGAGGGASGVRIQSGSVVVIAGGGGGASNSSCSGNLSGGAATTTAGNSNGGNGGNGGGGGGLNSNGGIGTGLFSGGLIGGGDSGFNALGGLSSGNATSGQFGGGGYGGGGACQFGGGGGGGYSGGNGSVFTSSLCSFSQATGGGSVNYGTNQNNSVSNNGGGQVIIECLGAAAFTADVTPNQPVCANPTQGSLSIDLTGDLNGNTSGVEYAIVSGNSFSGTPTFADITADPFSITSGFGTTGAIGGSTYTIRIRLKYNPTLFIDNTYTLNGLSAGTIYVNHLATGANNGTSWADAFTDLQNALANPCPSSQIWVSSGTYKPTSGTDRTLSFVMKNGVAIYGGFAGTETLLNERDWITNVTILSGDIGGVGNSDNSYHVINNDGLGLNSSALIDGFTICGGSANGNTDYYGGGVSNNTSSPSIVNCTITGNYASYGGGIFNFSASPTITNCNITGNQATGGGGMFNNSSSNPAVVNCIFSGNQANDGGGIYNVEYSSPGLTNCTFSGNKANNGGALFNNFNASPQLKNSIIWGNSSSVNNYDNSNPTYTFSLIEGLNPAGIGNLDGTNPANDPLFINQPDYNTAPTAAGDLRLKPCSPAINAGNNASVPSGITTDLDGNPRIYNNATVDMGAYEYQGAAVSGPVVYVNDDATGNNDGASWTDAFSDLQSALALANTCSNITEIWVAAGTYKPTSGADRSISFSMKNGVAIYAGFIGTETLLSERNWNTNLTILSGDIGGVGNSDNSYHVITTPDHLSSSAILDGLTITGGNADSGPDDLTGGGIRNGNNASPTISNCRITENSAQQGGGWFSFYSYSRLINVAFSGNNASTNGGGMSNTGSLFPNLSNVVFSGNNAGNWGGGIYNQKGSGQTLTNVTFSGNNAAAGGGIYYNGANLQQNLKNCIFWGNSSGIDYTDSEMTIANSILQENCPAGASCSGVVISDPLFISQTDFASAPTTAGDMRLQACSPAINTGDNASVPSGITTDLDGNPRFFNNGIVDMGAYEYQAAKPTNPTNGGEIAAGQAGCSPFDPAEITVTAPAGYIGTLEYQWQGSTDNTTYSDLSTGTYTATTYNPDALTVTTWYKRLARVSCMTNWIGAAASDAVKITVNQLPTATASVASNVSCFGTNTGSVSVSVSGGQTTYSYAWSTNPVQTASLATGLTTGTYAVTVTDGNGCTATASAMVNQPNEALTANAGVIQHVKCYGNNTGSVDVSVSGGTSPYIYSWSTNPVQTAASATGLTTGTYTVTVTDENGCTTTASTIVNQPNAGLTANAGVIQHVKCYGNNTGSVDVSVSGGTSSYTYAWSTNPAQTAASTTGLISGTYAVTVTDENGCTTTASATVNQPNAGLTANAGVIQHVKCYGNNNGSVDVSVSGGTSSYTYVWSTNPGQTTALATGLTTGTYTVTVTDGTGCSATSSATINQPNELTATASVVANVSIYEGSDGSVTVSSGGGTTAYSYKWSTNPEQTTQAATGLTVGTYWVTVTDANSCSATSSVLVTQPTPPTLQVTYVLVTAVGSTQAQIDWTRGNSDGSAVFMIKDNTGLAPPANNVSYTPNAIFGSTGSEVDGTGWYCVYDGTGTNVTVTSLEPSTQYRVHICEYKIGSKTYNTSESDGNPVNFNTSAALVAAITVGENVSCNGLSDGNATVSASGGNPSYGYLWSTTPAQTAQTATGLSAGTYSVTVTDGVSATITSSVEITQPDVLAAIASVSKPITCHQGSDGEITVSVSGGTTTYSYAWSTTPVQTAATAAGLTVGSYSVTVTDANGCTATSSASITQPQQWWPELNGPTPVCQNSTGNVYTTDVGMTDYTWLVSAGGIITSGGTATDNTVTITWTGFGPQTVSVNYTSPAGCVAVEAKVKNVMVNIAPTPVLTGESNVTQSQVVTYSTPYNPGNTYSWNASHGNPELCFPYRNCLTLTWDFPCGIINPGYVRVTETNTSTGCSTTVTKWITIAP